MVAAETPSEEAAAALPLSENDELSLSVHRAPRSPPLAPGADGTPVPRGVAVDEVMTRKVATVRTTDTVFEALGRMIAHGVSGLPVVRGRRVVGIITQNDVGRVLAERTRLTPLGTVLEIATARAADDPTGPLGRHAEELRRLPVKEAMTPDPVVVPSGLSVGEAADRMEAEQVKRLPVVNAKGDLVGILTRRDLVRSLGERPRGAGPAGASSR